MNLADLVITDIFSVHRMYNAAGARGGRTGRSNWAILFKYEGETVYETEAVQTVSDRLNLVVLPKGVSYSWECRAAGSYYAIEFECADSCEKLIGIPVHNAGEILKIYRGLEEKWNRGGRAARMECICGTYELLLLLMGTGGRNYVPADKRQRLKPALEYIADHYNTGITNEALAQCCGMSTVYFRKLFTETVGISPVRFVREQQMKKACELLRSDFGSIADIAQSVGYVNIYDFSRAFKREIGMSPREYAKQGEKIGNFF